MSTAPRYTQTHYDTATDAVRASLELNRELVDAIAGKGTLFVEADHIEFLARRTGRLLEAALRSMGER